MRWHDLFVALSLVLVIEGILPFLNPRGAKSIYEQVSRMDDRALRLTGLVSMAIGTLLLYLIN